MARGVSEAQKRAAAVQAGRRMISRGERPLYRVTTAQDGSWGVDFPGVVPAATTRREALAEARDLVAAVLDVEPTAFDVEAG